VASGLVSGSWSAFASFVTFDQLLETGLDAFDFTLAG
jgi:hypothetical protein